MDSDGYFTIKRNTYHQRVRGDAGNPVFSERMGIKQVVPIAVDMLHDLFGGSRGVQKPSAKNGRLLHSWDATDRRAYAAVCALRPYLRIKSRQADLLIELRRAKTEKRTGAVTIHDMNSRWGKTVRIGRRRVGPDQIAARQSLFERVKALNDTRSLQPKLG